MASDLDAFLRPRSIAVVGASGAGGRPNTLMTTRLHAFAAKHGARFHAVTPVYPSVLGVTTVPTLANVDDQIDLAVLLTGVDRVVDHFAEACAVGARFAVIFASGFSEIGPAGAEAEARLRALVERGPTRLLGPNTNLNAFSEFRSDLAGPAIALITQSGHQGRPIFQGQELGIRLSHWAPTGNEIDLEFADFCEYFADRPEVGAIAAYIEGFKDGATLVRALDHAARRRTPIVIVKVGRTATGASMAMSHTGHLTGSDAVTDAVFRQYGVTRVDGLDELLDLSAMFCRTAPYRPSLPNHDPAGERAAPRQSGEATRRVTPGIPASSEARPGICVYSISGGTGAHMADLASAAGLHLPELSASTRAALHDGLIPSYLRVSNPVDCGGPPVMDARGRQILDVLLEAPEIDALIVPITGAVESMSDPMTRDLVNAAATTHKPIFVVWGSPVGDERAYREILLGSRLPVFRTFQNCVRAVVAWQEWSSFADSYESPLSGANTTAGRSATTARRVLTDASGGPTLSEHASKALLRAYGIRTTEDVMCATPAASARAAADLGLPVVMKVSSPDLAHKSDAGLVVVGVDSLTAVRRVHAELLDRARRAAPGARVDGILVCESISDGVETLVGVSRDDGFGPVVTVGLGGILVEALGDVAIGVPPFTEREARRMIESLAGAALLRGVRGRPAVDENALVDVIMKVQRLATDLADVVAELDINPLVVRREGAVALDALVVRRT